MKRIVCFFLKHKYVFGRELNNGLPTGKGAMTMTREEEPI